MPREQILVGIYETAVCLERVVPLIIWVLYWFRSAGIQSYWRICFQSHLKSAAERLQTA